SSYAFPGKVAEHHSIDAYTKYEQIHNKIEHAKHTLVIGGGSVGIELCGEIATDFKDKHITLVHTQSCLLHPNVFNSQMYKRIQSQLEDLSVKIILNEKVDVQQYFNGNELNYIIGERMYETNKKTQITADLTFLCTGTKINNKSLNSTFKQHFNSEGRLNVNNYLQVDGYKNIFAIGDISSKESKMAFLAGRQAEFVAKLIPLIQ
ncbi:unnamed protein product, partial [Didymodactylos carnosus]